MIMVRPLVVLTMMKKMRIITNVIHFSSPLLPSLLPPFHHFSHRADREYQHVY